MAVVEPGCVFLAQSAPLPPGMQIDGHAFGLEWLMLMPPDGSSLHTALDRAGWQFFYLAGLLKASAWGFNEEHMTARAVHRLLRGVTTSRLNCMEIGKITAHHFGGIARITVSAHARHIQESYRLIREDAEPKQTPYRLYV